MNQSEGTCPRSEKGEDLVEPKPKWKRRKGMVVKEGDPASIQLFWEKVDKNGPEPETRIHLDIEPQCWIWIGGKSQDGYGVLGGVGWKSGSHRFSWKIHFGKIPEGMEVCHKCNNRACVRPGHLFLGTHGDNIRHAFSEGRMVRPKGVNHPKCKMNDDIVRSIRLRYESGESALEISRDIGMDSGAVFHAVVGITWKHIPGAVKSRSLSEAKRLRDKKNREAISSCTAPSAVPTSTPND